MEGQSWIGWGCPLNMVALSSETVGIGKSVLAFIRATNKTFAARQGDSADFSSQEKFLARIMTVRTAIRHWYASREY